MNASTLILRAKSALEKDVKYKSPGKAPPIEATSWPNSPIATDCSGFLAWCLRISRKIDHPFYNRINGGWFETTAVHADGRASVGYCSQINKPRPGAMLVYPDYLGSDNRMHDGHMGLVVEVNGGSGIDGVTGIVHCSVGNDRNGSAIQETGPGIWKAKANSIIVWWDGIIED
ncbi:hypothetical protein [Bosea sp. (in: a-proteobacteria)]|uniref:hypothetical protein n=1 Tax=Bosea sp. (in: a-proteobacteria) TaxID=1871050 RepID=UPI003566C0AF